MNRKEPGNETKEVNMICLVHDVDFSPADEAMTFSDLDPRLPDKENRATPVENLQPFRIDPTDLNKTLLLDAELSPDTREGLERFLQAHADVFAWSHEDMPRIDPKVICHQLHVNLDHKLVIQKRRAFNPERYATINEEVQKLFKARLIGEVKYPEWMANIVLVRKANGKWQVCIDFTDQHKACPKDCFPLKHIDQLVDATAGHELLSFMDVYSGYNQIMMSEVDQEKITFTTD